MSQEDRDYEAEARAQGWKPEEEWEGEPDKFVDAETFVKKGDQYVGLMKKRVEGLEKKFSYQEQLNKDMRNQYERLEKAKQKEIEQLEEQIRAQRRQAVTDGDGKAFDEAEKQLDELRDQKAARTPTNNGGEENLPPWAEEWKQENKWYGKDTTATAVAMSFAEQLRNTNPFLSEKEFLDQVTEHVKQELPHKFKKSKPDPIVDGDGGRRSNPDGGGSADSSYKNLPPEAKRECTRLMNEGIIKDKEVYAQLYFED